MIHLITFRYQRERPGRHTAITEQKMDLGKGTQRGREEERFIWSHGSILMILLSLLLLPSVCCLF